MGTLFKFVIRIYFTFLFLIIVVNADGSNSKSSAVCNTPECKEFGDLIKKNLNPNGKPCHDFYDYVCHRWEQHHPRPPYTDIWNVEQVMEHTARRNLRKLLEDRRPSPIGAYQRAKVLYRSCMSFPYMESLDVNRIKKIMKKVGKWPMFHPKSQESQKNFAWAQIDNSYIGESGESAFLDYYAVVDTNGKEIMLAIGRPYTVYGMLKRLESFSEDERKHYKTFLRQVVDSVAPSNPKLFDVVIKHDIVDVLQLRDEMRQMIEDLPEIKFKTMTIDELQAIYNKESKSLEQTKIQWLSKIRAISKDGKNPYNAPITGSTRIKVDESYFLKLIPILTRKPQRIMANHVHLYFAEKHLLHTKSMRDELGKSITAGITTTGAILHEPERWVACILSNNMKEVLSMMYVDAYFPPESEVEINEILEESKRILEEQVLESDWLDPVTKNKTIEKIDHVKKQIGYPPRYHQYSNIEPPGIYDVNVLDAEAYYVRPENKIYVPAAYLQPPIYSKNLPYVIHYATTVALFGHELYHGFDAGGIRYNINGEEKPWWPEEMYNTLKKQSQCFKQTYDKYRNKELLKYNIPATVKLPSTLEEDLADVMGLELAYKGYQEKFRAMNGECEVLPGFEKFTCNQLFFIAFANSFCSASSHSLIQHLLVTDTHSLPNIRVNGAVERMDGFSTAFNCKPGDPLVFKKTCDIWTVVRSNITKLR